MAGLAHGMKPSSKNAPSKEVAEEMVEKTPAKLRSNFSKKPKKLKL
jgi:hypothetical protein